MQRKRLWILPDFQKRMIKQWALLVLATTVMTHAVTFAIIWYRGQNMGGNYFFVSDEMGQSPLLVNPVAIQAYQIALPGLILTLVFGFLLSVVVGVYYSHRLAGPVYRMRRVLTEARQNKEFEQIVLRKNDEFKELAEDINQLLAMAMPKRKGVDGR